MACRICKSEKVASRHSVREMMNGTGEAFDYFQCGECRCLQIAEVPADLGRHYAGGYYSIKRQSRLKRHLQDARLRYLSSGRDLLGRAVTWVKPPVREPAGVVPDDVPPSARILEVGGGNGYYLHKLLELGYRHLHGIDPFMDEAYVSRSPIRLERRSILQMDASEGPFDCILFGHSLEHIAEQFETLTQARKLLAPNGVCILGLPWAASFAWETYREDWVQLDAPRHLYLHTPESLAVLARACGLSVVRTVHDSTSFQFWGSEQYRRKIPLHDERSWVVNPKKSIFSQRQIREFEERAAQLNREDRGDQVRAFLMRDETA